MSLRVGALCAGYGGLELGLQLAGIDTDLIWVSETDKHASAVLDARFGVPNLGDLTQIVDPPEVDVVTAGFPCQPVSHAGKGAGVHDERWLIRDVVTVARRAGAQWIFMENVRGLLSANKGEAFGQVLDALAEGGFDARWACIRADQSVGACHRRERWFCVAYASGERHGGRQDGGEVGLLDGRDESQARQQQRAWQVAVDRGTETPTDPDGVAGSSPVTVDRRRGAVEQQGEVEGVVGLHSGDDGATPVADPDDGRLKGIRAEHRLEEAAGEPPPVDRFGPYGAAVERWERIVGRRAPDPTDERGLNPWFVEWMMGLPSGGVCDMGLSRTQELKMLGNGVIPHQAAVAYEWLLTR